MARERERERTSRKTEGRNSIASIIECVYSEEGGGRQNKVVELCQPKFPLAISNSVTELNTATETNYCCEKFDFAAVADIATPETSSLSF